MLRFVCPHCGIELRVPEQHLGARGTCKKCEGRIALLGKADPSKVQMASTVADKPVGKVPSKPATERQLAYLRELGVDTNAFPSLSMEKASDLIEQRKRAVRTSEAPTEKQLDYLKKLKAPEILLARVNSKESASELIEALYLAPTPTQREALRTLGATGAQMATLKNRATAQALILTLEATSKEHPQD